MNLLKKKGYKKGELTTTQLVTLIVLIVSFIVILFLIFRLNLGETTNKEICHNSVILREKSGVLSGVFSGPLDCRTNYLCISGGGNCEEINPTSTVKVDIRNKNETMKALADEMADCWWMFGEGEIEYAGGGAGEKVFCSICSIVEFDSMLKQADPISYGEFYNYLKTTPKSSTQTYLQYMYSTNDLNDIEKGFESSLESYFENEVDFGETYFILTGRTEQGYANAFMWNFKFWRTNNKPYPVVIMKRTSENYEKIGCNVFLTKA